MRVLQTVQKKNILHMDSTYLQTVQKTMCKIHIHILSTHSKDILRYQYTLYVYVHVCIMYTSIHSNNVKVQQIIIYSRLVVQQIVVQGATDYAYAMLWVCIVWCPVMADVLVQCVRVVQLNCVKVQCMACCVSGSVL